ncbi:MAG: Membrane protein of an transporter complex [Bacteroidetes bacterium]|jgi:lipopolysaccharide transport system permease protein|nr:Membrane protein of an transporter complex [Bacteroidota bacterium]MDF2453748.1 Membrane protein of an transporter complex [Bacteroidota bacterium]
MNNKGFEEDNEPWDLVLDPKTKWYSLRLNELFRFKDLLLLFVRRDFVSIYKQTILGPLWFFVQPIITSIIFAITFGMLGGISTDGLPQILFYLTGITLWNYFSDTLVKTSDTFTANASIFGKVYFPRLIVPLSVVLSNLVKFGIQFLLFLAVWLYYIITTDKVHPNSTILLIPFLILLMGFLGLAMGIIISSITTKYRDLKFLVSFGVQLLMYASPIVFPLSLVTEKYPQYKIFIIANPITSIIEAFKYAFLGVGELNFFYLGYSLLFTIVLFFIGLIIFNKVEKSFMDTV